MPNSNDKGLPLEYLHAKRSGIVAEWRETRTPTDEQVARWAKQVSDLSICIAAKEAALAEK